MKDAELKGAIAGAAFATEQLRDRKEADKLVITARDTEVKQLAALNEQCGMQTDEILRLRTQIAEISEQLTGAKIEVAVLQQKGGTADSASDMATDAAKIAVEAGMAVLKQQLDATQVGPGHSLANFIFRWSWSLTVALLGRRSLLRPGSSDRRCGHTTTGSVPIHFDPQNDAHHYFTSLVWPRTHRPVLCRS